MGTVSLVIKTNKDTSEFVKSGQPTMNIQRIENLIKALKGGVLTGSVDVYSSTVDPVAAAMTFTLVSAIATDAITIGTVTLTASSTPANENQWEIDGADDAADAASLAAAINAHSVLSKVVVATSASNVVTVTAIVKGLHGNQIPTSSADATITASGTFLSGGTGGPAGTPVTVGRS